MPDASELIIEVAFFVPLYRTFDYLAPDECLFAPQPGQRVSAIFGHRETTGVIIRLKQESTLPQSKLKALRAILDVTPVIAPPMLELAYWCSKHYVHPIGEVVAHFMPASLRKGAPVTWIHETRWHLATSAAHSSPESLPKNAHRQRDLLALIASQPEGTWTSSIRALGFTSAQLNSLRDKGLIEEEQLDVLTAHSERREANRRAVILSTEQAQAAQQIIEHLDTYQTTLLDGITGSGKTEVYLHVIKAVLARGRQALILIPEINLTPQTLRRFQEQLHCPIGLLHSTLNDNERLNAWELARQGVAKVIIGTRSAIFTPFKNLGCIIVDEEHDSAYKQQDGFRYHARDVGVMRAYKAGIPIILGSATPSLESRYNAINHRYTWLKLKHRPKGSELPRIQLLDIRSRPLTGGLSRPLITRIHEHLEAKKQVLVFINRRGYAPVLMCHDCGWLAECPHCDARLALHTQPLSLRCHHCNFHKPPGRQCESCASQNIAPLGTGTEQTEKVLQGIFPDYPVIRIDRDSTRNKSDMQEILRQIGQDLPCILVGTQMLAKGHNFPLVTLVAVLNADGGLFSVDFRATEHTAQLLTQVAGRAGRAEHSGEVIIQTCHGDHPLLQLVCQQNYEAMSQYLLEERKTFHLPPATFGIHLLGESKNEKQVLVRLNLLKEALFASSPSSANQCVGPIDAPLARKAGVYQKYLAITCPTRAAQQALCLSLEHLLTQQPASDTRIIVDVDPVSN